MVPGIGRTERRNRQVLGGRRTVGRDWLAVWLVWLVWAAGCSGAITDARDARVTGAPDSGVDAAGDSMEVPDAGSSVADAGTEVGRDAAASAVDAALGNAGGGGAQSALDAAAPPEGQVAVFIATTHGGWTATTCDGGQTWFSQERSSARADGEHHPYVGFAGSGYFNGQFVMATGWGSERGHLFGSPNGMDWTEIAQGEGVKDFGAVMAYDHGVLAAKGSSGLSMLSVDGAEWVVGGTMPEGLSQLRQGRGFADGLLVMVSTGAANSVHVSEGDPDRWQSSPLDSACMDRIQVIGGIAQRQDTVLLGSRQALCVSDDRGRTWEQVKSGEFRSVFADASFLYATEGNRLWRSTDGRTWEPVATEFPATLGEGHCFAGTCIVVPERGGGVAYRSEDGGPWTAMGAVPSAGGDILSMAAGYVVGDARCGAL